MNWVLSYTLDYENCIVVYGEILTSFVKDEEVLVNVMRHFD